jgi:hypothetical protein
MSVNANNRSPHVGASATLVRAAASSAIVVLVLLLVGVSNARACSNVVVPFRARAARRS